MKINLIFFHFSLEIKNTLFNIESLSDELDDNIIPFMLSRKQLKDMNDKFGGKKSRQARSIIKSNYVFLIAFYLI